MKPIRRLTSGLGLLVAITIIGTLGYIIIEGWAFLDSFYMTIITITTVGYDEVYPLSANGRIFSIFLMIGGVGGALYALTGIIEYVLEGHFGITLGRRRMKARIAKLKEHFIICGFGRVGKEIARTFNQEGVPFVIIDNRQDNCTMAEEQGYLCISGDATSDEILKEAGINQARGLVAAVGLDTDNTYITLSARGLHSDLFIEARASSPESIVKLQRAGADRVISPQAIGGRRMAMLALRPTVVDFIDTVARYRGQDLQMENVEVSDTSPLIGLTLEDARHRTGAAIVAVSKQDGKINVNPSEEEIIQKGDQLIVIGTQQRLTALEDISEGA
ncbi:potassium channel family protein [Chloroflexota bacterium]